jgi:hypothetical protein
MLIQKQPNLEALDNGNDDNDINNIIDEAKINLGKLKFMFSKKATKNEEIFTVYLTLCSKCQIDGEDFINFCGLLRKHEL